LIFHLQLFGMAEVRDARQGLAELSVATKRKLRARVEAASIRERRPIFVGQAWDWEWAARDHLEQEASVGVRLSK
jgi:hypothetical protein